MANEERLISATKLVITLAKKQRYGMIHYDDLMATIAEIPTVDAVEEVHGRWIKDGNVVVCSNCGEEHEWDEYRATFCEDCGAKMDGGNDDGS